MIKTLTKSFIVFVSAIVFIGCGAESELEDMGIPYTQDGYFKHGVYKKNIPVLDLFYEAGMPIETTDKYNNTALDNAIKKGQFELIKYLVDAKDAKINVKSIESFIKNYRIGEDAKNILKYLFSKGVKLNDSSVYYLLKKFRLYDDIEFLSQVVNHIKEKKGYTRVLVKIYESTSGYVRGQRRNTKATFDEINNKVELMTPIINKVIENGADVKEAYSEFEISYHVASDKHNWILTLAKPLLDSGKIDINKDFIQYDRPILLQTVHGVENIDNIKQTVQYLFKMGADPLAKMKDSHYSYGNRNAVSMFCRYSNSLSVKIQASSFYPEICQSENVELFKLLFTDKDKYEKLKSQNKNLSNGLKAYDNKQYAKALKLLLPYAKQGNISAQEKLGDLYDDKKGVKEDLVASFKWHKKAAEQGSNRSQYLTAVKYEYGLGIGKNKVEAKKWYEKAYKGASSKNKKMIQKRINSL
jgi:hypothetical protein